MSQRTAIAIAAAVATALAAGAAVNIWLYGPPSLCMPRTVEALFTGCEGPRNR